MKGKPVAEQEIAQQLLLETVSYAESSICRHRQLLHYFGEEYTQDNCGACDNCLHPKEKFEGSEYITVVLQTILEVKELFKAKHIVNILVGKNTATLKSYKHHIIKAFGRGSDHDDKFWNAVIRQALIANLIKKDIDNYGLLKITDKGREFLKKPFSIMLAKDHDYDNPSDEEDIISGAHKTSSADQNLFDLLKDLRKKISRKENLPPFVIFQDPSLEDMSIQYPIKMDELTQITGVGVGKAQKYGKPFLDLIQEYVEENDIMRPNDMIVKSVVNKSGLKVYIIRSIDRKLALGDIAHTKNLTLAELITEIESIVASGTKLDIDYYTNEVVDPYHQEEIIDYFQEAESDSIDEALAELGEDEFNEIEIRLMRIKYMSEVGN
jgi:ATP-dependent DNA helicase RecQ